MALLCQDPGDTAATPQLTLAAAVAQRRVIGGKLPYSDLGNLPPLHQLPLKVSASKSSIRRLVITENAPTRAFSWLKAATTAFTFKTLLRHYAKQALTPRSLYVKLGP